MVIGMDRERFEQLVMAAVESLPEELRARLENISLVVEDYPTRSQLSKQRLDAGYTLLGLYEGFPLTRRGYSYGNVLPDKITIFQRPIESMSRDDEVITREIAEVVKHEIGHYFGISDARLSEIEKEKRRPGKDV